MTLNTQRTYEKMFEHIFVPIMERFQIPKNKREYLATYYIHGLIAIVNHWVIMIVKIQLNKFLK